MEEQETYSESNQVQLDRLTAKYEEQAMND